VLLPRPDGPQPIVTVHRAGVATPVEVASVHQYRAEVDDLQSAHLDGTQPRVGLGSSRGSIATLMALDPVARIDPGSDH
jgi:hypothetical protein